MKTPVKKSRYKDRSVKAKASLQLLQFEAAKFAKAPMTLGREQQKPDRNYDKNRILLNGDMGKQHEATTPYLDVNTMDAGLVISAMDIHL